MTTRRLPRFMIMTLLASLRSLSTWAAGVTGADAELDAVVVTARRIELTGAPRAASEGTVLADQIQGRPLLRTGELLEVVPGLIVTQHTGDGKANQYFLRGFNLDHGTDFSTTVEGVPANLPTHAHGQGYLDINFVIPEFVERVVYRKGTYYAELGNFSAAGSAELKYLRQQRPFLSVTTGADDYLRTVAGGSFMAFGGEMLLGAEFGQTDGPWELPQNLDKRNLLARWSRSSGTSDFSMLFSGYRSSWQATDQVPQRAVDQGTIDRFGYIDPTNGGETQRYSLSGAGETHFGTGRLDYTAYGIDYGLQLFSNFTYAINRNEGDQFEQYDDRQVFGGSVAWEQPLEFGARALTWRSGLDLRYDDISPVGLYLTNGRERYERIREDDVEQLLTGIWTSVSAPLTPWMRAELGVRADRFDFEVRSSIPANSGSAHSTIVNPKASVAFGPWAGTEYFLAAGGGYHSNDARGGTISVDPVDGVTPADPVTPLARAKGYEIGLRSALIPYSQVSIALWQLDLDSELLFIGDGGTTEATRPTRRQGIEVGLYSRPLNWLLVDVDYAWSKGRFRDDDPVGAHIPGSLDSSASLGVTVDLPSGWFAGARLRHLGSAPLIEDNSVRAPGSTLVNLDAGRRLGDRWRVTLGIFNLFDAETNDIAYFYESQLPSEAAPVEDIHFHPVEPRTLRATLEVNF